LQSHVDKNVVLLSIHCQIINNLQKFHGWHDDTTLGIRPAVKKLWVQLPVTWKLTVTTLDLQ